MKKSREASGWSLCIRRGVKVSRKWRDEGENAKEGEKVEKGVKCEKKSVSTLSIDQRE